MTATYGKITATQLEVLRSQIRELQNERHEVCKFLRQLNSDEFSITDEHTEAFVGLLNLLELR